MLVPHLAHRKGRQAALIGGAMCLATIPFTPIGVPVLVSGLAIFVGLGTPSESPSLEGAS
jgi:hypothetical protein